MITVFYLSILSGRVHNGHFIVSYYWAKFTTENGSRKSSFNFQVNDYSRRHCWDSNKGQTIFYVPSALCHDFVQR